MTHHSNRCLETETPAFEQLFDDVIETCVSPTHDIFNTTFLRNLASPTSCSAACASALGEWTDTAQGWGCCSEEFLTALESEKDIAAIASFMDTQFVQCGVAAPQSCQTADGSTISAVFEVSNFNVQWWNAQPAAEKASVQTALEKDIAMEVGVAAARVSVDLSTSGTDTLIVTATVLASSASQGVKVQTKLKEYDKSRRQGAGSRIGSRMGIKSLTSTPAARRTSNMPVTAATTAVAASYLEIKADTTFFVAITVSMPYTKAEFDGAKQAKYKAAVAATAGTSSKNVIITSVTEGRRRAGGVDVATRVRLLAPLSTISVPAFVTCV